MVPQVVPQKLGLPGRNSTRGRGTPHICQREAQGHCKLFEHPKVVQEMLGHANAGHVFARPPRDAGRVGSAAERVVGGEVKVDPAGSCKSGMEVCYRRARLGLATRPPFPPR